MSSEIVITHQQFQQLISALNDISRSLDGIKKELQQEDTKLSKQKK